MSAPLNPFDPEFLRDPYPTYAELRRNGSVTRLRIGVRRLVRMAFAVIAMQRRQGGLKPGAALKFLYRRITTRSSRPRAKNRPGLRSRLYTVSRYAEVSYVLRNAEIFSSEIMGGSQAEVISPEGDIAPTSGSLIAQDPPEHTRQRSIVNRGFSPRRIAELEPRIRKNAEELFAAFEGVGSCDLMAEFANPLPVSVIADLLGLDPSRRDDFKRWSTALIVGSTRPGAEGFGPSMELFREFRAYMTEVIEERRRNPGDDLISTLVHTGEGEGILDPEQVISFATLLLAAGSETTTNLIGNAVLALLENPELMERVQNDPKLVSKLVEETLRYDSPIQLTARVATRDCEVGGVAIRKGSIVAVLLASANRDEAQFEDPDRFDIDRPNLAHLAFGFGNHFCIGASLARLEGAMALEMIVTRLRGMQLTVDDVERHGSVLVRGPSSLPIRFEV
ncbi:MAG: cytochrome P450 [Proteobacteria bacterium]|nr:cytochrome P450 [Pseudomonadota bacterium]